MCASWSQDASDILDGRFLDKRLHHSGRSSRARNANSKLQGLLSVMCEDFAIVHSRQHSPIRLEIREGQGERERPRCAQQAIDSLRNFVQGWSIYVHRDDKWEACEFTVLAGDWVMFYLALCMVTHSHQSGAQKDQQLRLTRLSPVK